MTGHRTK